MIRLIENEFKKIFKKKAIYILLFITLAYIILSNFLIKYNNNNSIYFYTGDLDYYENELKTLDPNNPSERPLYIEIKSQLEMSKLTNEYGGGNSWQAYIINTNLSGDITTIVSYECSDEISDIAYKEAKQNYDTAIQKFKDNNWKYFAKKALDNTNKTLAEQYKLKESTKDAEALASINNTIKNLEVEKQVNTWRLEKNISYENSFLNTALKNYYSNKINLISYDNKDLNKLDSEELQGYTYSLEQSNLNKYYIDNMITLKSGDNRDILINLFGHYELFILIIGIVISASIVSEEFSRGTIKLLLVKPYNRYKILISKFIVCIFMLVLVTIVIAGAQLIFGGLIQGFESLKIPAIEYNFDTNKVETMNIALYILITGICKFPMYILLLALAFTCSTVFTNTALAVAIPFLGYISAQFINQIALLYKIKQIIYFVTPNWDLTGYLFGKTPTFSGITMPFSITICAIYLILMLALSLIIFKKRDIKNI